MKASISITYGLLAINYLARHKDQKIVLSQTIAKEYGIPVAYLRKLMQYLERIGVLRSKRGPKGGYFLAKPITQITMLEIIEAVDSPLSGRLYLDECVPRDKFARNAEKVYQQAIDQAGAFLKKTKISDLTK